MAGHIQDRWYKTTTDEDGNSRRVKSDRYGTGMRYRARYVGPDGTEKSKSFPDKQKRLAEQWLTRTAADMSRGEYIDPRLARITFQQYAEKWVATHTTEINSREAAERRLRIHAYPYIGSRPLPSFQPGHIRTWLGELEKQVPAASHRRIIYGTVSGAFSAAVDDGLLPRNPCKARSVQRPRDEDSRIEPWQTGRVFAVRSALPERFRAAVDLGAGCGLRQGEVFGLSEDEVDFEGGWLTVTHQLKRIRGKYVFAPPKGRKLRDVPLSESVSSAIKMHAERFTPIKVTLPWRKPDGPAVTKLLYFSGATGQHVRVSHFNDHVWKPALSSVGVIGPQEPSGRYPSAPEHGMHALRHFYASVLLDAGENIRALSQYLGHSDPGFTLRTYTHLMPSSEGRTRRAVDNLYGAAGEPPDGPETAQ